jgi:hypothetical protein
MDYEINFLKSLLFTISIETVVLFLLFKLPYKSLNINNKLLLLTGFLATFSTLPYLWFILPMVIKTKLYYTIISEVAAVLIESVIIMGLLRISYKKAISVSFICNMTSFLIGLLIKWP